MRAIDRSKDLLAEATPSDDGIVSISSGDPDNDWMPQAGKQPSLTTILYVRDWAKDRCVVTSLGEMCGDELAAFVLAYVFPEAASVAGSSAGRKETGQ